MKSLLLSLAILAFCLMCRAQDRSKEVKLIRAVNDACDQSFDARRLKTRLSSIMYTDSTTIFTVQFADNCCAPFKPAITFEKGKLTLLPYRELGRELCTCHCCIAIRYEIAGLSGKTYKVYFKEKEVQLLGNYYDTVKPTFLLYKGTRLNRTNKYGFKEGTWIEFYQDGREKVVRQYDGESEFFEDRPRWSKGYYPSGRPFFYERQDTGSIGLRTGR